MQVKFVNDETKIQYPVVLISPAKFVTIELASHVTGLSKRAIQSKIYKCIWVLNRQYRKAPDGRIFIDLEGVEKWIMGKG